MSGQLHHHGANAAAGTGTVGVMKADHGAGRGPTVTVRADAGGGMHAVAAASAASTRAMRPMVGGSSSPASVGRREGSGCRGGRHSQAGAASGTSGGMAGGLAGATSAEGAVLPKGCDGAREGTARDGRHSLRLASAAGASARMTADDDAAAARPACASGAVRVVVASHNGRRVGATGWSRHDLASNARAAGGMAAPPGHNARPTPAA